MVTAIINKKFNKNVIIKEKITLNFSKILAMNYFTTKLFFFNVLYIIYLNKNNKLMVHRKSRTNYFWNTFNFILKKNNWNTIHIKLHDFLLSRTIVTDKLPLHMYLLTKNTNFEKIKNIQYKKLEYLVNRNIIYRK